jgi:hypothetical protein
MKIATEDLRRAFEALVSHLEGTGQEVVDIPWDYYWDMPKEERYDPYSEPRNLNLGQISDDWNEILEITDGTMPCVGYALVWLSSVLRAVGEVAER